MPRVGQPANDTRTPFQKFKDRWKGCERCELAGSRSKLVLYRLKKIPAPILFVGEAPGESEDSLGECFVGPAGHLIDQLIERAGMPIEQCAFTNLVACIPLQVPGEKMPQPPLAAIRACEPRLTEFIDLVSPRAIVWVGELAAKYGPNALASSSKGYSDFSRQYKITHPAALLRMNVAQQGLAIQRTIVNIKEVWEDLGGTV